MSPRSLSAASLAQSSSSLGANGDRRPKTNRGESAPPLPHQILEEQRSLVEQLSEVDRSAPLPNLESPVSPTDDARLYTQQLAIIHALERLDVHVLDLGREQMNELLQQGFEPALAERVRSSMRAPWQLAVVEQEAQSSLQAPEQHQVCESEVLLDTSDMAPVADGFKWPDDTVAPWTDPPVPGCDSPVSG